MQTYRFIGFAVLHTIEMLSDECALRAARFITQKMDVKVQRKVGLVWTTLPQNAVRSLF